MKRIVLLAVSALFSLGLFAQPIFDLGIKAGVNNSKVTASLSDFTSESIVKAHIGAFMRVGIGRVYLQPEAYFSSKGGEINSNLLDMATKFDFNNIDVPILLGVKIVEGGAGNIRLMAGPVFSYMTSNDVIGDIRFTRQYFEDNYFGYQYGIGVDIWSFFLDARIEKGANEIYVHPDLSSKNSTFMVTLGFKIL